MNILKVLYTVYGILLTNPSKFISILKMPKCEIFDPSDFHDFYIIKSLREGDFGVKIKFFYQNI